MYGMLVAVVLSVGLSVVGPKILGKATDLVFAGIIGRQMPAGSTKARSSSPCAGAVRAAWHMLAGTDFTPGKGIDFGAVGNVLLLALCTFLLAGLLMAVATRLVNRAVNKTVYHMREDLQAKLAAAAVVLRQAPAR